MSKYIEKCNTQVIMNHIGYIYNGVGMAPMASQPELKTKKYDFLCLSYILQLMLRYAINEWTLIIRATVEYDE